MNSLFTINPLLTETLKMADNTHLLLRTNLKQLKLPTMGAEFEKLAREAAAANEAYEQYLLRLAELEVAARSDRKSTRLNSSHGYISYAVFCLKKKKKNGSKDAHESTVRRTEQDNYT